MVKQPSVKILVGYHKPAQLLKSDILVPIHLGRALATQISKDGQMSEEDYQWMLDNMIGDDTGDNISHLNRYFCELTAIYWAWKNYDKLGNPDYIGLMHYRRLFKPEDIENAPKYDIVAAYEKLGTNETIYSQFMNNHWCGYLGEACRLLINKNNMYEKIVKNYLNAHAGYFCNMFIMKKDLFFEYCEHLFAVLLPLHKKINYPECTYYNQRMPGFLAERLTGIFITAKQKDFKINNVRAIFKEVATKRPVKPAFKTKDAISVVLSSDDNYANYLGVVLTSIKDTKNKNEKYDICVLDGGISSENKKNILLLKDADFSIRFIDVSGYLNQVDNSLFYLNAHFTQATYYRFFIPEIFSEYDRILYLDTDIAVNHNLSELFHIDLGKYAIAAAQDVEMHRVFNTDEQYKGNRRDYLRNTLGMKHPETYFQAGILLLDIKKLKEMNFTAECLRLLKEIKTPLYVDQCIMNAFFDGRYKPLDMKWNVLWQLPYYIHDLEKQLRVDMYKEYFSARENPYIVHYASQIKPWINADIPLAEIWWQYARMTPFYEEILYNNTKSNQDFNFLLLDVKLHPLQYKLKKLLYKFKMKFYKNSKKEKYIKRYNEIKFLIKSAKNRKGI